MDVLFHENKASMDALFHENKASIDALFRLNFLLILAQPAKRK